MIKQDKEHQKMIDDINNINNINPDDIKLDGVNVGNVDSVDKINNKVDIQAEELKYLRDIAEQQAINEFVTKMVVPDVKITFTGEIKETADVKVIGEIIKEDILSELNSGAEGLHQ